MKLHEIRTTLKLIEVIYKQIRTQYYNKPCEIFKYNLNKNYYIQYNNYA